MKESQKSLATCNTKGRSRNWFFTYNNYEKSEIPKITETLDVITEKYIFQEEKKSTPHLQGHMIFKEHKTLNGLKKIFPKWHLEMTKSIKAATIYCTKIDTRNGEIFSKGFEPPKKKNKEIILEKLEETKWYKWQEDIIKFAETEPDDRKIMWIEDIRGCIGKSRLAKYLFLKHDAIIADGKKIDVFNQTLKWLEEKNHEKSPHLVILDIPRHNADYVNYGLLEKLKDGLIYSGKYEGGACVFESPHIIIFANFEPCFDKFTEDRWIHITPPAGKEES